MSVAANDFINTMRNAENSDEVQWGHEMARANKYDLGEYDLFSWHPNTIVARGLEVTPEKFTVPQGNLFIAFGDFMFVHIFQGEQHVRTRYAILNKNKFFFFPMELQADFSQGNIGIAPWFKTPLNTRKPNKNRHKRDAGELFNLTGNILIMVNDALDEGFLKPNGNIIYVDFAGA